MKATTEQHTTTQYEAPRLEAWGDVNSLTQTGLTNPGGDAKQGSVMSNGQ